VAQVRPPEIPRLAGAPWVRGASKTYRILRLFCGFFRTGFLSSPLSGITELCYEIWYTNYKRAHLSGPGRGADNLSVPHKRLVFFRVTQSKRTEAEIKNRFVIFFSGHKI